jgi:hypothetical protein
MSFPGCKQPGYILDAKKKAWLWQGRSPVCLQPGAFTGKTCLGY